MDSKADNLSPEESLQVIQTMISKAKNDYFDSGLSALLWGSVVIACSLITYANYFLHWRVLGYIWFLTVIAIAPQIIISIRERKEKKYKSHQEDLIGGIWVSYAIAIFLISFLLNVYPVRQESGIYLALYGIPTFATGYGRRFRPMLIGAIACWILAILSVFISFPNVMFVMALGGLLAWFIPGLILRDCYLKAKRQHV